MKKIFLLVFISVLSSCSVVNVPSVSILEAEQAFDEYEKRVDAGEYEKAAPLLDKLLVYFSDDYNMHMLAVYFYSEQLEKKDKALQLAEKSLLLAENKLQINRGQVMKSVILEDYNEALTYQELVVRADPSAKEMMFLANLYSKAGRTVLAVSYYKNVLILDPDYDSANEKMGLIFLYIRDGRTALPYFKKAIENEPERSFLYTLAGMSASLMNDYKTAEIYHKASLLGASIEEASSSNKLAVYYLGVTNFYLQKYELALEYLQRIPKDYGDTQYFLDNITAKNSPLSNNAMIKSKPQICVIGDSIRNGKLISGTIIDGSCDLLSE